MVTFKFSGKTYKFIGDGYDHEYQKFQFDHCVNIGDWNTLKNRIANGLKWNWLEEI